jgi:hypothetical protein
LILNVNREAAEKRLSDPTKARRERLTLEAA